MGAVPSCRKTTFLEESLLSPVTPAESPVVTPIYRRKGYESELCLSQIEEYNVDIRSSYKLFNLALSRHRDMEFLGTRSNGGLGPYVWRTFADVDCLSAAALKGLEALGLLREEEFSDAGSGKGAETLRCLGIFSKNREEWFILDQAANKGSLTLVPLYDALSSESLAYILEQTRLTTCAACSSNSRLIVECVKKMKQEKKEVYLKNLILLDTLGDETKTSALSVGLRIVGFSSLLRIGGLKERYSNPQYGTAELFEKSMFTVKEVTDVLRPPTPDTLQTISYTSGTTGAVKGVMLSHSVMTSCVVACLNAIFVSKEMRLSNADVHISYLPLAHAFERLMAGLAIGMGIRIGIYSGSPAQILDDISELKPTVFVSVPRMFHRILDGVFSKVDQKGVVARGLFDFALKQKIENLRRTKSNASHLWDPLLFEKVRALMGGRLRLFLSGAAPLLPEVGEQMECLFGVHMLEGYGLTETLACSFVSLPFDPKGVVGSLVPSSEFRLETVAKLGYFADPENHPKESAITSGGLPAGEVCLRGNSVFPGYFRRPDLTEEAVDRAGWFHTGDIAVMYPSGHLRIVDRKKNIFKLSQGEYVIPDKVENLMMTIPLVQQIFVTGKSTENCLVAIVVIDRDHALHVAPGLQTQTFHQYLAENYEPIEAALKKQFEATATANRLKGFEKIRDFRIVSSPFTVDNGLLTPTFKLKRFIAQRMFAEEIDEMYNAMHTTAA